MTIPQSDIAEYLLRQMLEHAGGGNIAFVYGPMGSGKSKMAIYLVERLTEHGRSPICISAGSKPRTSIASFGGERVAAYPAVHVLGDCTSADSFRKPLIVDEAQFLTFSEIETLSRITKSVDQMAVCFGLYWQADGKIFEGTRNLISAGAIAFPIPHDLRCWCGKPAVADVLVPATAEQEPRRYATVCDRHRGC